ncbi:MAG: hypothetical protein H8E90_00390, partial [Anaerolineales bacterium]|nr:hypothetical protein [Anaerolineales bacterium]
MEAGGWKPGLSVAEGLEAGSWRPALSPVEGLEVGRDFLAVATLLVSTLAFFWKIAFTNLILVGLDVFTYFYPYK